jgi:hypothetical protein
MVISELIERIRRDSTCSFTSRADGTLPRDPIDWTYGRVIPADVLEFFSSFQSCILLGVGPEPWRLRNSWQMQEWPFFKNVNERFGCEDESDRPEYFDQCYPIANSTIIGQDGVGIDLHPDRFGWMFYMWVEDPTPVGFPVVAHSFTEWLERTLNHGLDADHPYWKVDSFQDLGPANPSDPEWWPYRNLD